MPPGLPSGVSCWQLRIERLNVRSDPDKKWNERVSVLEPPTF
jgi:hypothetical protein